MPTEELNRLAFERDLAVRQAKLAKAHLQVVAIALNDNRPLEALRTANDAIDELEEELDVLDEFPGDGEAETPAHNPGDKENDAEGSGDHGFVRPSAEEVPDAE